MEKTEKLKLADLIIGFFDNLKLPNTESPKMVGTLNRTIGINGFKTLEIGTPVFDVGDKYVLIFESLGHEQSFEVRYYKDSLKEAIDFDSAMTL